VIWRSALETEILSYTARRSGDNLVASPSPMFAEIDTNSKIREQTDSIEADFWQDAQLLLW